MRLYKTCPSCGSVQIRRRRKNSDYVCDRCGNHFGSPRIHNSWS